MKLIHLVILASATASSDSPLLGLSLGLAAILRATQATSSVALRLAPSLVSAIMPPH